MERILMITDNYKREELITKALINLNSLAIDLMEYANKPDEITYGSLIQGLAETQISIDVIKTLYDIEEEVESFYDSELTTEVMAAAYKKEYGPLIEKEAMVDKDEEDLTNDLDVIAALEILNKKLRKSDE